MLEQKRLNIDLKDYNGCSVLWHSVCENDEKAVKMILQHEDVSVNAEGCLGVTPLHWACIDNAVAIAALLIGYKDIDINKKESSWETPLVCAILAGRVAITKLLVAQDKIDLRSQYALNEFDQVPMTPFMIAKRMVKSLSENKVRIVDHEELLNAEEIVAVIHSAMARQSTDSN